LFAFQNRPSGTRRLRLIVSSETALQLVRVGSEADWAAFHRLRREVLFEARGRFGVYDEAHPDDRLPENEPLILVEGGQAIGALRLDSLGNGSGGVRTVAITPARQRQGCGSLMMALLERRALAQGMTRLEVRSAPDAVGFYEKLGWRLVDANPEHPFMDKEIS